ncbi:hypothetical protein [Saccharothrix variisporea]|uniref:Uncharacterized protein n=1 Tax=Saccharothrix variisporea TaxID=543527 RepID=A0A495X666_9PSEU|nr:hypothetical protein [Saccharothrix variisporea]NUT99605.1 hypothetical protein [Saccharothrix sp.]RKT69871.1 hypothetical protein DFJ66_3109 [Saccharothrix variisporea]
MRNTEEADTLAELIDDCTEVPAELRPTDKALPEPRLAAKWQVSDANAAQVANLDAYV